MTHISGFERSQLLLLPEAVDDYVGPDNSVRFIDAFVDGLDLAGAGFRRVEPKATGRPGYSGRQRRASSAWSKESTR
jgi:transposase